MANWNGLVMTDKGIALQSKVQAGEVLNITKLKLGSGTLPEETDIRKLTDLIKPEQNLGIGGREPNGDYCKISATISNVGLEAGYYVRELGVFAQDPDDGEILYAYTTDGAPDYLPAEGGSTVISQEFSVNIAVSDTDKINVEIDPGALATMGYVQLQIDEHNEDASAHEKAFSQHNTDETAHYDMTGATSSKAGKRGFAPAPKAGDQNSLLAGDGTWHGIATTEDLESGTSDSVIVSAKGLSIARPMTAYTNSKQIGLDDRTFTWPQLYDALPNNSMIIISVNPSSTSPLYNPNLSLPNAGTLHVSKGSGAGYCMQIILIPATVSSEVNINVAIFSNETFSGWKKIATTDIIPTGTILPFAGSTIPTGFLACNGAAVSRTTYAALFAVIGTTYGVGNGSTTFNLPKADDNRFLEFSNTLGTLKNAGLPNITGYMSTGNKSSVFWRTGTGAITQSYPSDTTPLWETISSGDQQRYSQLDFDASKSNSIYGSSNTVQPKSLTIKAIIKY